MYSWEGWPLHASVTPDLKIGGLAAVKEPLGILGIVREESVSSATSLPPLRVQSISSRAAIAASFLHMMVAFTFKGMNS